ncbi:MAG TPA: hypothetical protein VMU95_35855 [Trebonia sp.]|nr:hypothetical protein [Trebonia sp.]
MTIASGLGTQMRFSVDGWNPAYGTSMEAEEQQLQESTADVTVDIEVPATEWHPIDPVAGLALPSATLFVDGVRRIEARVWINDEPPPGEQAAEATAALCASYAAGVVCSTGPEAQVITTQLRRGLFTIARHAGDVVTRAGSYQAEYVKDGAASVPLMLRLSEALQRRLAEVEVQVALEARSASHRRGLAGEDDLLIIDGPLRGRQHLPRAIGYIKSHRSTYLPKDLNSLVGRLEAGQRTPVFLMGTSWQRHSWYLRLPGDPGAPWAGVVRIECSADLVPAEVVRLASLSQSCLARFASDSYKDSRAPQNLYPIGGLERELRHRLGDPKLLYRALREASRAR